RVRKDYISQGVTHAEFRFFAIPVLLETFQNDSGPLTQRVVDSFPRGEDPGPALERITKAALGPHGEAIVAVAWSGMEEGHPPKELTEAVKEIQSFNDQHPDRALAILAHVGES